MSRNETALAADATQPANPRFRGADGYFGPVATELVILIMEQMTPQSLTNFVLARKSLLGIFQGLQGPIMANVLKRLPEFDIMLHYFTASEQELQPGRMLHPRTVIFNPERVESIKIVLHKAHVKFIDGKLICPKKIELLQRDIDLLWNTVKCVDWWVEFYPQLRWREDPIQRRCVRGSEEARLRKAIARWWLFAFYFHGNFFRDFSLPKKWQDDPRLHHIRVMSTTEICELEDLLSVIYEAMSKDICSSLGRIREGRQSRVDLVPWGQDEGRHSNIVNTYMKLDPEQLQYFIRLFSGRKKTDIIRAISTSMQKFSSDREVLSSSINTVLQERMMLAPLGVYQIPRLGIGNEDRATEQECRPWSGDAWMNGKPPLTQEQINAFPTEVTKRVPYGDDGSDQPAPPF
ncbi:hypothetical protein GGR56DRAFT_3102 [Xylariaceae sp. FL0804]|nr:hypothetical protein GGR56DRAFT_3102 [Xylariaceae sp. FL0804]